MIERVYRESKLLRARTRIHAGALTDQEQKKQGDKGEQDPRADRLSFHVIIILYVV
jgi:hypothetical protein